MNTLKLLTDVESAADALKRHCDKTDGDLFQPMEIMEARHTLDRLRKRLLTYRNSIHGGTSMKTIASKVYLTRRDAMHVVLKNPNGTVAEAVAFTHTFNGEGGALPFSYDPIPMPVYLVKNGTDQSGLSFFVFLGNKEGNVYFSIKNPKSAGELLDQIDEALTYLSNDLRTQLWHLFQMVSGVHIRKLRKALHGRMVGIKPEGNRASLVHELITNSNDKNGCPSSRLMLARNILASNL